MPDPAAGGAETERHETHHAGLTAEILDRLLRDPSGVHIGNLALFTAGVSVGGGLNLTGGQATGTGERSIAQPGQPRGPHHLSRGESGEGPRVPGPGAPGLTVEGDNNVIYQGTEIRASEFTGRDHYGGGR